MRPPVAQGVDRGPPRRSQDAGRAGVGRVARGVGKTHLAVTAAENGCKIYFGTLTDLVDSSGGGQSSWPTQPPPQRHSPTRHS